MKSEKKHTNKIQELIPLDRRFKSIFGVRFLEYLDKQLALLGFGAHLDVVRFDNYLQTKYDDYVDGMSMAEFLELKFGEDVKQFVEELI